MNFFPNRGRKTSYGWNVFIGIDQFLGTLCGIDSDETISSYCGRNYMGRWQQKTIDWFALHLFGEANHCLKSIEKSE